MTMTTITASTSTAAYHLRSLRAPDDYPHLAAVLNASAAADGLDWANTAEDVANYLNSPFPCDPERDVVVAEIDGTVVGYGRAWWRDMEDGVTTYISSNYVAPAGRGGDLRRAMLRRTEARLREVAATHPPERPKLYQLFTDLNVADLVDVLTAEGYTPVRYAYKMVRPTLDDIPDYPLPPGFEVRPVRPEQIRAILAADVEAFRGLWGFSEPTEADLQAYIDDPHCFQPEMWQIAWDTATGDIAGQVKAFINRAENEQYNRRRGYTEDICVARPYRRRGLARALIARSLRQQREMGMTESALGVDADNETGALRVYLDCGFRIIRRSAWFRKAMTAGG
jgi:GNAT superfamily N-acetyltransferase